MDRLTVVLCGCMSVAACNLGSETCTLSIEPGIVVLVQDSVTGLPVAQGATGQVTDGSFSDPLVPSRHDGTGTVISLAAASERPGNYTVQIRRPGYLDWSRSNVRVTQGSCHVDTAEITARIAPQP